MSSLKADQLAQTVRHINTLLTYKEPSIKKTLDALRELRTTKPNYVSVLGERADLIEKLCAKTLAEQTADPDIAAYLKDQKRNAYHKKGGKAVRVGQRKFAERKLGTIGNKKKNKTRDKR